MAAAATSRAPAKTAASLWMFVAALSGPCAAQDSGDEFSVTLLVTSEVRGAVFPVNKYATQCTLSYYEANPHKCYGGAARRKTILEQRDAQNTVTIDAGAYFYGSGLFYPLFLGQASNEFFGSARYDAWGLNYRDLSQWDGTFFKDYVAAARAVYPELPPAVHTNLNLTGDPNLTDEEVAPYSLTALEDGRWLAFLSLADPSYLQSLQPGYADRHMSYSTSVTNALAQLRRLPEGEPDVIVCHMSSPPRPTAAHQAYAGMHVHSLAYAISCHLILSIPRICGVQRPLRATRTPSCRLRTTSCWI